MAIVHGDMAHLVGAADVEDAMLTHICRTVVVDEKWHEAVYVRVVGELFETEPDATVHAMAHT